MGTIRTSLGVAILRLAGIEGLADILVGQRVLSSLPGLTVLLDPKPSTEVLGYFLPSLSGLKTKTHEGEFAQVLKRLRTTVRLCVQNG